jgi:hypothetical protein
MSSLSGKKFDLNREDALSLAAVVSEEMKGKRAVDEDVMRGFVWIVGQLPRTNQLEILTNVLKYPNVYGAA